MEEVAEKLDTLGIHKDLDGSCQHAEAERDKYAGTDQLPHCLGAAGSEDISGIINDDYFGFSGAVKFSLSQRKRFSDLKFDSEISVASSHKHGILEECDEEESLSSDMNCFSDEETSSLAGSYDDIGREDEDDSTSDQAIPEKNREEKLQRLALRRHLDQLAELVVEREYAVQQAREELEKCKEHLKNLENDILEVKEQIKQAESSANKALYCRLRSKHETLLTEANVEKELHSQAVQNVEDAEFYLAQAYIEHGKFLPLDDDLQRGENLSEKQTNRKAAERIKKEVAAVAAVEQKRKIRDKEHLNMVREKDRKTRQAVLAAKKNREVAMKYLQDTMARVRQRESEEEEKSRGDLNQRMNALLSLKKNLESNKENLRAVQARDRTLRERERLRELTERQRIEEEGGNPDEVLTRRKRLRQFEREKEAFERKQREREIGIVNKVLSEEKQMKRRYQQQPQLFADRPRRMPRKRSKPRFAPSSGSESMEYGADVEDTGGRISQYRSLSKVSTDEEGEFSPYGLTSRDEKDGESGTESDETLVKPEFRGLWEEEIKEEGDLSGKTWKSSTYEFSKLEQEMMKQALSKQRENIVQKQIAAGREFKGAAFESKPEVIIFNDFDVGKSYKKKVTLTNVSYSQNFCKFVGMSENLKDFVDVLFDPPGVMSAGLTCDFVVTFKPMVNKDIDGRLEFMAQTGLFYVPFRCAIKKCKVVVDTNGLDFGHEVIGETRKKSIILTNKGALSTRFKFLKQNHGPEDALFDVVSTSKPLVGDTLIGGRSEEEGGAASPVVARTPSEDQPCKPKLDATSSDDSAECIRLGKVTQGVLNPFDSVQLDVVFAPTKPGDVQSQFKLIFEDKHVDPILILAKGVAMDLPVWVEREIVDLKICMYDRLYQDSIIVHNRATSALRLRFEVPKELRNHVDILPRTAYIQAESKFSSHLKFLPRLSLADEAGTYFEASSGALDAPVVIRLADQTQPLTFAIKAIVTSSDFEFDAKDINFGHCTVYESVVKTVSLRNKSVLPQQFGFVGNPEYVEVQPNEGFGTILPNEKIDLDLIFSPSKAQDYSFELTCKSGIGREFKLPCKAIGVLPPLSLSQTLVKFRATALNDTSSTHIFVINDHTSANEFTHPVPRIGTESVFPVGPTSYEFVVPVGAPFSITPKVGTVLPGKKSMVHISLAPRIDPEVIKSEVLKIMASKSTSTVDEQKYEIKEPKLKGKQTKAALRQGRNAASPADAEPPSPLQAPTGGQGAADIQIGSKEYNSTHLSLLRSYENNFQRYKIPCFIAFGECGDPDSLSYNTHNTLYLQVDCPIVRPALIALSDNGDNVVDFQKVAVGQRLTKVFSVQNISDRSLQLKSTILDPAGPFEAVNALREIAPDAVHAVKVSFTPTEAREFFEVFEILSDLSSVQIKLRGHGVQPRITLEPGGETLDVGDALVGDTITAIVKMRNLSELPSSFELKFGSQSSLRHMRTQTLPTYFPHLSNAAHSSSFQIGPPNESGIAVFSCKPWQGNLEPGETKQIEVCFAPDHASENYRDELAVAVNGKEEFICKRLVGRCWATAMYARGWDRMQPVEETVASRVDAHKDDQKSQKTVLLSFHSKVTKSSYAEVSSAIDIGCVKPSIPLKKSGEFAFEGTKEAIENGFSIEPQKGFVEPGGLKQVTFKWAPPKKYDPSSAMKTAVQLILRGETIVTYNVMLRGYVVTSLEDDESTYGEKCS